jgi:hypothetical protein
MNEYVQGKTEILKEFSAKGYKATTAGNGVRAQATLYKDGKKIGLCIDEGRGGEISLDTTNENLQIVKGFLETLPKYKFNDMWEEQYSSFIGGWKGSEISELQSWKVHDFAEMMLDEALRPTQLNGVNIIYM